VLASDRSIVTRLVVLLMLAMPSCWLAPPATLSPAHRRYIRAETFARIQQPGDFPPAVRRLMAAIPFDRVVMAGCSEAHCLVEYQLAADHGVFELEVFGLSPDGAAAPEWRRLTTERVGDLRRLKQLATSR
jgi:hypothetical protein